jgi:type IV pilus assembly protein PilA
MDVLVHERLWSVRRGREQGMTLVELLIVLVVIAVLLAIAVPSMLGQRNRANDAVASSTVRQAAPSIKAYFQDHATYAGMTVAALQVQYDKSLPGTLVLANLSDSGYCVQTSHGGRTWRQNGPAAPVERLSC